MNNVISNVALLYFATLLYDMNMVYISSITDTALCALSRTLLGLYFNMCLYSHCCIWI